MDMVSNYSYVIDKEHYSELLKICGTKENVILYINETYSLMRLVTDIKIKG